MEVLTDTALAEVGAGPEKYLTTRERDALVFAQNRNPPYAPLSTHLQMKLFALFLQGIDCAEIARLNQGVSLGQIIAIRIENKWDEKRQDHVERLLKETALRLQQTTLEGIDFITAQLAAVHKIEGDKIKKFLQSGDEKDLGEFTVKNWSAYKATLDILKTLTGADKVPATQKHVGEILHKHEHSAVSAVNRAMTHDEAKTVIKAELEARKAFK